SACTTRAGPRWRRASSTRCRVAPWRCAPPGPCLPTRSTPSPSRPCASGASTCAARRRPCSRTRPSGPRTPWSRWAAATRAPGTRARTTRTGSSTTPQARTSTPCARSATRSSAASGRCWPGSASTPWRERLVSRRRRTERDGLRTRRHRAAPAAGRVGERQGALRGGDGAVGGGGERQVGRAGAGGGQRELDGVGGGPVPGERRCDRAHLLVPGGEQEGGRAPVGLRADEVEPVVGVGELALAVGGHGAARVDVRVDERREGAGRLDDGVEVEPDLAQEAEV